MKQTSVVLLAVAAAATVGCGGGGSKPAATTSSATSARTTATQPSTQSTAKQHSCEAKGITPRVGKEGTCIRNGKRFTVANRTTTLRLKKVFIRLRSTAVETHLSGPSGALDSGKKGKFVLARVAVANRSSRALRFDPKQQDVRLRLSGQGLKQVYPGETAVDDSFVSQNARIRPHGKQVGTLVFLVPNKIVRYLHNRAADPQLLVWEPGTGGGKHPPDGAIRLWK